MPFSKSGKTAIVPEDEDKSDGRVNEDLRIGNVCIVLRDVWLGGPLPSAAASRREKNGKVEFACVSLSIVGSLHRKLLRALPYWACGPRCSGPPSYFSRLAITSPILAASQRAILAPL
jgi:hypothetical protein